MCLFFFFGHDGSCCARAFQLPGVGVTRLNSWTSWLLGSTVVTLRLSCPWHVQSSRTRDPACVPCVGKWIPIHRTTREVFSVFQKHFVLLSVALVLPRWLSGYRINLQCRRLRLNPWVGKIPWRRACQPTPVFLPGEPRGQRRLVGYSLRGCKESDTTEATECVPSVALAPYSGLHRVHSLLMLIFPQDSLLLPSHSLHPLYPIHFSDLDSSISSPVCSDLKVVPKSLFSFFKHTGGTVFPFAANRLFQYTCIYACVQHVCD